MPTYAFTTIDDPLGTRGTSAADITNNGQVVGTYFISVGLQAKTSGRGFFYSDGSFSTLSRPTTRDPQGTHALGINEADFIVGWSDSPSGPEGFVFNGTNYSDPSTLGFEVDGI